MTALIDAARWTLKAMILDTCYWPNSDLVACPMGRLVW